MKYSKNWSNLQLFLLLDIEKNEKESKLDRTGRKHEMIIIDLREKNEVEKRELLAESINIPAYSQYNAVIHCITEKYKDEEILLICSSGNRSKMVYEKLPKEDQSRCEVFDGNIQQFNILIKKSKGVV